MTKVKIGVGRFYNANACSIVGVEEINLVFKFEGFEVHANAGRSLSAEGVNHSHILLSTTLFVLFFAHACFQPACFVWQKLLQYVCKDGKNNAKKLATARVFFL